MLVNELSKHSSVTTDSIRYYTRMGLLQPVRDPVNSYKYYNSSDIKKIKFIIMAKQLGFKLAEVLDIFKDCQEGDSPCARVREIIYKRIIENRELLSEKMALQSRMEKALEEWVKIPDAPVDDNTICFLIESFFEQESYECRQ